ncbi:hypothetical protein VTN49DRAFT_5335 [Thermomyces lanuginosus]|uniref:uncharacterized protein n=1 Tax=Thermomyces lanuginosus TaxID=5541 RepID=UPI003743E180
MSSVFHNATCHSRVRAFLSPQSLPGGRHLASLASKDSCISFDRRRVALGRSRFVLTSAASCERERLAGHHGAEAGHDTSDWASAQRSSEKPTSIRQKRFSDYLAYMAINSRDTTHTKLGKEMAPSQTVLAMLRKQYPSTGYRPPKQKKPFQRRLSAQIILAAYIARLDPYVSSYRLSEHQDSRYHARLEAMIRDVFDAPALEYLSASGYRVEDVVSWAWILKAEKTYQAALRLVILHHYHAARNENISKRIPFFITTILLRREHLDVKAFRLLLVYSTSILTQQPLPPLHTLLHANLADYDPAAPSSPMPNPIRGDRAMFLVELLLHHARELWPAAQLTIAKAFSIFLTKVLSPERRKKDDNGSLESLRAELFNSCLQALAIPSKYSPFVSASIQQRAQFELLKVMANHQPVLPVSRRGYQAVVAVQLAHKKTDAEKEFASYKAPSWPPWKENRLGIDADRGTEGMRSRAMQVLAQMREAGYSFTMWDKTAAVLAGWDTDGSPTIQTRSLAALPSLLEGEEKPPEENPNEPVTWAARIRATRTLREAWACFLSYQDAGNPPSHAVYEALAEKLVFRRVAMERDFDNNTRSLPGDGPEVFPEPASARDVIYVRADPPSLEDLLKEMDRQGIRRSQKFVALLLSNCSQFQSGLRYLSPSMLGEHQIKALCTLWPDKYDAVAMYIISTTISPQLFRAFIKFLCSFATFDTLNDAGYRVPLADLYPIALPNPHLQRPQTTLFECPHLPTFPGEVPHPRALSHAVQLLRTLRPRRASVWLELMRALSLPRLMHPKNRRLKLSVQRFLAWYELVQVQRWMADLEVEPGMPGLQIMCRAFCLATIAGARDPTAAEEAWQMIRDAQRRNSSLDISNPVQVPQSFDHWVKDGLQHLKEHFDRLVLPQPVFRTSTSRGDHVGNAADDSRLTESAAEQMLQVPDPAVLHSFIRALGAAGDRDSIIKLLRWMRVHAKVLKERADEYANGERQVRRAMIAIRIGLEGLWRHHRALNDGAQRLDQIWTAGEQGGGMPSEPPTPAESQRSGAQENDVVCSEDPYIDEAYNIIEEVGYWGPWPTDEEVWDYLLDRD